MRRLLLLWNYFSFIDNNNMMIQNIRALNWSVVEHSTQTSSWKLMHKGQYVGDNNSKIDVIALLRKFIETPMYYIYQCLIVLARIFKKQFSVNTDGIWCEIIFRCRSILIDGNAWRFENLIFVRFESDYSQYGICEVRSQRARVHTRAHSMNMEFILPT